MRRPSKAYSTQVGVEVVERRVCGCSRRKQLSALSWTRLELMSFDPSDECRKNSDTTTDCCRRCVGHPESRNQVMFRQICPNRCRSLPDVEPTPSKVYNSHNRETRNVYIRKIDLEKFGCTAGYPACEIQSGQEHTAECRKRLDDVMTTDASTSNRVEATRVRQAGFKP